MCRNRNKDRNPFSSPPAAWSFAAILVLGLAVFSSSTVWGQTVDEAQTAVEEARQSVALDPESVPARLQLAQALYGAGEIDEAIETWRAVVKLSPTEASAAAMVKLLTGYRGSIDEKLELLEKLVDAGLYSDVVSQCMRIINSTAASDQQQAKAALLQAEMAPTTKAGGMVREARIRYGDAVDPVHAEMIEAAAAIDSGNEIERAEAVGRLAALVKDAAGKREAILAEFFLLRKQLQDEIVEGDTKPLADAAAKLNAWVVAQPKHRFATTATDMLFDAYLKIAKEEEASEPGQLTVAEELEMTLVERTAKIAPGAAKNGISKLVSHVKASYPAEELADAENPTLAADTLIATLDRIKAWPITAAEQASLDQTRNGRLVAILQAQLAAEVEATDAADPTAPSTAVALLLESIGVEFIPPNVSVAVEDKPLSGEQIAAIKAIAAHGTSFEDRAKLDVPPWTDKYIVDWIGLCLIQSLDLEDGNIEIPDWPAEVAKVVLDNLFIDLTLSDENLTAAVATDAMLDRWIARADARLAVIGQITGMNITDNAKWDGVLDQCMTILRAEAGRRYSQQTRFGRIDKDDVALSLPVQHVIGLAKHRLTNSPRDEALAKNLFGLVTSTINLTTENPAQIENVIGQLQPLLPKDAKLAAEIALITGWREQVRKRDQAQLEMGLTVAESLDPLMKKALVKIYDLHADREEDSLTLGRLGLQRVAILNHYRSLGYESVVEEIIAVKGETPIKVADLSAAMLLASQKERIARKEFVEALRSYQAEPADQLDPAMRAAIDQYITVIGQCGPGKMLDGCVDRIRGIAVLYTQNEMYETSAGIYAELEKLATDNPILSMKEADDGRSIAAQAAGDRARTLARLASAKDAEAREAAGDATEDAADPPALSAETTAAIDAYIAIAGTYPKETAAVAEAIKAVMQIGLDRARQGDWSSAEAVFDKLLASKIDFHRPDRLQLARGVCRLGRAIPDHSREMLDTIVDSGMRIDEDAIISALDNVEVSAVPYDDSSPANLGDAQQWQDMAQTRAPVAGNETGANQADGQQRGNQSGQAASTYYNNSREESQNDANLLAVIQRQQSRQAQQIAQLRDPMMLSQTNGTITVNGGAMIANNAPAQQILQTDQQVQIGGQGGVLVLGAGEILSEAELARRETAIDAAYAIFQAIRSDYPDRPTAEAAREEIIVMVRHWRSIRQWTRAIALAERMLADQPDDRQLPKLRLEIARDRISLSVHGIDRDRPRREVVAEMHTRFDEARDAFTKLIAQFADDDSLRQTCRWELAETYRSEARAVATLSPTLARGMYVAAARRLRELADRHPDHPRLSETPQMLWKIAGELQTQGFHEEAIQVWAELTNHAAFHSLAIESMRQTAAAYRFHLGRPLKAAETYQELNFAEGASSDAQNNIFQIGSDLKDEARWVEALHVLEMFVDGFPHHGNAGQALTMIGQIHQENEAWEDAIAAYRRVLDEYKGGPHVKEASWSIAQCKINLSGWRDASADYRAYLDAYPEEGDKRTEALRRIEVLKDLDRYQTLVDEPGQRKAFDAQYQIARIVADQLNNPVKSIIEYRKVATKWPTSHMADDALLAVGTTLLTLNKTDEARDALLEIATKYPDSPVADDALLAIGRSYEAEATQLATVTRGSTEEANRKLAQRRAYQMAQEFRGRNKAAKQSSIDMLRKGGKTQQAELEEASYAGNYGQFNDANTILFAQKAEQEVEQVTASQLADRQDKINAALRRAVDVYAQASRVAGADKADEALLQMATIYDQKLKNTKAAMNTWLEIVRQFSGTAVAEDASWRIAQNYERQGKHAEAIEAYSAFLRNYRRSPKAGDAQFAIAENHELQGNWVEAMDAYTNYRTNFPSGPLAKKAADQINWIKTYRL